MSGIGILPMRHRLEADATVSSARYSALIV